MFPNSGYGRFDSSDKGFKSFASKDRLTLVLATNASGTIRIPPLIIGKSINPVCFHANGWGPLPYRAQQNSWMTTTICRDWYLNVFIPEVQHFIDKKEMVYLILDNCSSHPIDLDETTPFVKCIFLPPNCTAIFQPLDMGIIESVKRRYRHILMSRLAEVIECWGAAQQNSQRRRRGDRGIIFGNRPTVKDTCVILNETWNVLPVEIVVNCWLKGASTYLPEACVRDLQRMSSSFKAAEARLLSDLQSMQSQYLRLRKASIEAASSCSTRLPEVVLDDIVLATHPTLPPKRLKAIMEWWGRCDEEAAVQVEVIDQAE